MVLDRRYASPAVMLSPMMSREASEDEEARLEGRPMVSRAVSGDRGQVRAASKAAVDTFALRREIDNKLFACFLPNAFLAH